MSCMIYLHQRIGVEASIGNHHIYTNNAYSEWIDRRIDSKIQRTVSLVSDSPSFRYRVLQSIFCVSLRDG